MLALAFRQLVDRGFVAFYTILVSGNLKPLAVVVLDPNAVLINAAVLDFADSVRHGKADQSAKPPPLERYRKSRMLATALSAYRASYPPL